MEDDKSKIVVIGGGHAGLACINSMASNSTPFEITLIDRKDYYEVNFVNLWEMVSPDEIGNIHRIKYEEFIVMKSMVAKSVGMKFIQGSVKDISSDMISIESGEKIPYDFMIISTGTFYPRFEFAKTIGLKTIDNAENAIRKEFLNLKKSKSALIIGGGVVGVELAGEIKSQFPEMDVQIVHAMPQLMEIFHPKTGDIALGILRGMGIEVHLNEMIEFNPDQPNVYKSRSGREYSADNVYLTFGVRPSTGFVSENSKIPLNEKGEIIVDGNFRIKGKDNMFAIGDAATIGEGKQGVFAFMHGKYLGKNFEKLAAGKVIKPYKPHSLLAAIPIGRKKGIFQLGNKIINIGIVSKFKHSKFFIKYCKRKVGL